MTATNPLATALASRLRLVAGPADWETASVLFREYQQYLGVDLCFQGFERELRELPVQYGAPAGGILLAEVAVSGADAPSRVAECVGVRALQPGHADRPDCCEMKRLFVRPDRRGLGLGRQLAEAVLDLARRKGYRRIRLDTLRRLERVMHLYDTLGFREIPPYYQNPLPEVRYLEAAL